VKAKCLGFVVLGFCCFLCSADTGRDAVKWQEPETIWGAPNDGLRMGVAVTKTLFAWGEPIIVGVRVQNLSDKPREVFSAWEGSWNISVAYGPNKAPVRSMFDYDKAVPKGYAQPWRYGGSSSSELIQPGGTWYEVAPVSRYFDLRGDATYIVTISYPDRSKGRDAVLVQAPPIHIEVKDMDWADPPASQMLQVDWRANRESTGQQQVELLSRSARDSVQLIGAFAQAHPDIVAGKQARRELLNLRAQLDELLKEPPSKPGDKPEQPEAKPQADATTKQAEPEKAVEKAAAP